MHMKNSKSILLGVTLLLFIVFLVVQMRISIKKDDIYVGAILPISGPVAQFGEKALQAMQAVGVPVKVEDDACDPTKAISAFNKLISNKNIKYIIGPICGSSQEALAPLVKDSDIVLLFPSSASEELELKSGGKVFNIMYSLEDDAEFSAVTIGKKYKRVAVISYQNKFSAVLRDTFVNNMEEQGKLYKVFNLVDAKSDLRTELLKVKAFNPDVIYVSDISFFFGGGLEILKTLAVAVPIYSQYPVGFDFAKSLALGSFYTTPNVEIVEGNNLFYETTKVATDALVVSRQVCGHTSPMVCVTDSIKSILGKNAADIRSIVIKEVH